MIVRLPLLMLVTYIHIKNETILQCYDMCNHLKEVLLSVKYQY